MRDRLRQEIILELRPGQGHSDPIMVSSTPQPKDVHTHQFGFIPQVQTQCEIDGHSDGQCDN